MHFNRKVFAINALPCQPVKWTHDSSSRHKLGVTLFLQQCYEATHNLLPACCCFVTSISHNTVQANRVPEPVKSLLGLCLR
jgi:hypothetical protein